MKKFFTIGLCIAASIIGSFADPIFLLSSNKIDHLSENVFLDQQTFKDLLNNKVLDTEEQPNNIFVFDVKLNDNKYTQNPELILKELAHYPSLQNHFGVSSNDALSNSFLDQTLNNLQKGNFQLLQTNLQDFSFENIRNLKRNTNKKVAGVIELPITELGQLDELFHYSYSNFAQISRNNHLIILKFTNAPSKSAKILASVATTERMLQEDEPTGDVANPDAAQTNPDVTAQTTSNQAQPSPLGISSAGFAGYVISIFGVIAIYFGFQIMSNIRTPTKFYKDQLQVGKEH